MAEVRIVVQCPKLETDQEAYLRERATYYLGLGMNRIADAYSASLARFLASRMHRSPSGWRIMQPDPQDPNPHLGGRRRQHELASWEPF